MNSNEKEQSWIKERKEKTDKEKKKVIIWQNPPETQREERGKVSDRPSLNLIGSRRSPHEILMPNYI